MPRDIVHLGSNSRYTAISVALHFKTVHKHKFWSLKIVVVCLTPDWTPQWMSLKLPNNSGHGTPKIERYQHCRWCSSDIEWPVVFFWNEGRQNSLQESPGHATVNKEDLNHLIALCGLQLISQQLQHSEWTCWVYLAHPHPQWSGGMKN